MLFHSCELRLNSATEQFYYRPSLDGQILTGTPTGVVSIRNPSGTACLVTEAALNWNVTAKRFECLLDTRESRGFRLAADYQAEIRFSAAQQSHVRTVLFDVVRDPWRANLTADDLLPLAPLSGFDRQGSSALSGLIAEAEEQLRQRLRAMDVLPGLLHDKEDLDRCHRLLALSLLYLSAAGDEKSGYWRKHQVWQGQYERAFAQLLSALRMDTDQDGAANGGKRNKSGARLQP